MFHGSVDTESLVTLPVSTGGVFVGGFVIAFRLRVPSRYTSCPLIPTLKNLSSPWSNVGGYTAVGMGRGGDGVGCVASVLAPGCGSNLPIAESAGAVNSANKPSKHANMLTNTMMSFLVMVCVFIGLRGLVGGSYLRRSAKHCLFSTCS